MFLISSGLVWLILLKISLIAFFLPNVVRWLKRNKPRTYAPDAISPSVLPSSSEQASAAR